MLGNQRELLLLGTIELAVRREVAFGSVKDDVRTAHPQRSTRALERVEGQAQFDTTIIHRQQLIRPQRIARGCQAILGACPRRALVAQTLDRLAVDQDAFGQSLRCLGNDRRSAEQRAHDREQGEQMPHGPRVADSLQDGQAHTTRTVRDGAEALPRLG